MPQIITDGEFDFGTLAAFVISCGLPLQCKFFRLLRQIHRFRSGKFKNNLTFDKYTMLFCQKLCNNNFFVIRSTWNAQWSRKSSSENIHGDITINYVINDIMEITQSKLYDLRMLLVKNLRKHVVLSFP